MEFWLADGTLVAREGKAGSLGSALVDGVWHQPSVRDGLLPSMFDTSREVSWDVAVRMGWDPSRRSLIDGSSAAQAAEQRSTKLTVASSRSASLRPSSRMGRHRQTPSDGLSSPKAKSA